MTIDTGNVAVGTLTFDNPGGGSYTIAANSSYTLTLASGTTGIAATLSNSGGSQFITAPVVLGSNLAVSTTAGSMLTISGRISGAFSLTESGGTGTLVLSDSDTYSGGTTLSAGLLDIGNAHALGSGRLTISGGSIGNTSGSALTLSNNVQTWSGNFAFVGPNDLNLGSGTVTLSASPTVTVTSNNLTVGGAISGSGDSLTKAGAGTLTLAGADTYSGGTTLSAGLLNIDNAHALGTGGFTITGGSIGNASGSAITLSTTPAENWNGNFAFVGPSDLNLSTAAITLSNNLSVTVTQNNLTIGGVLSGSSFLIKSGAGTLTLSGSNTYNEGTTLSAGQLNINNAQALGTGSFTIDGGTIANTSTGAIVLSTITAEGWNANFAFSGGTNSLDLGYGNVNLYSNRTVTVNSGTLCVGGVIADSGHNYSLTQNGGGVLLLYGANTYGGGTTINGGTLQAGSPTATGLSSNGLTLGGAGLLDTEGNSIGVGGLSGGGTIDNLAAATTCTLTVGNGNAGGTLSGVIQNTNGTIALSKVGRRRWCFPAPTPTAAAPPSAAAR